MYHVPSIYRRVTMTPLAIAVIIVLLFITALWPVLFAIAIMVVVAPADGTRVVSGGKQRTNKHVNNRLTVVYDTSKPILKLSDASPPYTAMIDSDLISEESVKKYLTDWNFISVDEALSRESIDLAFIISMPTHRPDASMRVPARIRYRLSADELTDKVRFHQHMAGFRPKNIARSFEIHGMSRIPSDHPVWIVRANWGWKGSANAIVSSTEELREAYKKVVRDERSRVLMSEYIMKPLLRDGRKFHARVVVIVGVISEGGTSRKIAVMLPLVELILAAKPYSADAPHTDTDIHDTHYGPNAGHAFLDPTEMLYRNTVDCLKDVFRDFMPLLDKYPESPAAYDAFGVDVIYRQDGTPVIMEVNKLPGLGFNPDVVHNNIAVDEIINGVLTVAVNPAFGTTYGDPNKVISLVDHSGPTVDPNPPRTYLYVGDQLEDADVARYLPGWRRITQITPGMHVDLIIGAGAAMASGKLYSVSATMKHRLQIKDLTDKVLLHEHLSTMAPDTIPATFHVEPTSTIPDGSAWIIRAGWGFDGQAVRIATTTEEMREICREFDEKNPKRNRKSTDSGIVATQYIRNPLLLNGRKFNVRVMMVAVVHSPAAVARGLPRKVIYMLRKSNITTAVLPYVDSDFANPDIHITHSAKPTDPVRYHFDEGYPGDANAAMDRMQSLLSKAVSPLLDRVECFPESPAGYEILGADIVFDDTERPYLIEINDIPGISWLKMIGKGVAEYSAAYLDFLFGAIQGEFDEDIPAVDAKYSVELARV